MKYYAIADLHGRFDLLKLAIEKIVGHAKDGDYKIITLGDYIDRGPQSKQIIDFLIDQQDGSQMGDGLVCLKGNHEAMMVETITKPLAPDWWVGNGGDATLRSYGWGGEPYTSFAYDCVPKKHIEWLDNLPLFYDTPKHVFVHAGIPQWNMNLPPSAKQQHKRKRLEEEMVWMLYGRTETGGWKGKHVVHGHHQFEDGPIVWLGNKGGRTDLDTYAWKTGRLVVGVFNDTQLVAEDYIEIKAAS